MTDAPRHPPQQLYLQLHGAVEAGPCHRSKASLTAPPPLPLPPLPLPTCSETVLLSPGATSDSKPVATGAQSVVSLQLQREAGSADPDMTSATLGRPNTQEEFLGGVECEKSVEGGQ